MSVAFSKFAAAVWSQGKFNPPKHKRILALDPGETTGWSVFTGEFPDAPMPYQWQMTACGQAKSWPLKDALENLGELVSKYCPDFIVYERYAVYAWKSQDHSWSEVPTVQIIGLIKTLALQHDIPVTEQTAQVAKHFCTDKFLRDCNLYERGQKHARDSIRHGLYYILFGNKQETT